MGKKISYSIMAFALTGIVLITSCLKDKEPSVSFDCTTSNTSYTNTIKTVMDNNCVSCHKTGGSASFLPLENYTQTKSSIDKITSRMNSSSNPMPPAGKLDQTTLDKVSCWKTKGLTE